MHKLLVLLLLLISIPFCFGQQRMDIEATLVPEEKSIKILQEIVFVNTAMQPLNEIYFHDWANSYATKTTQLAKRFAENFDSRFHFERERNRGFTKIDSIYNNKNALLNWHRGEEIDILKVVLPQTLQPQDSITIKLSYTVKLPNAKFTRFGITKKNDYILKHWYIAPAIYDKKWHTYSNKDIDDLYIAPTDVTITWHLPQEYQIFTELDTISNYTKENIKTIEIQGKKRMHLKMQLLKNDRFYNHIVTDKVTVITNINERKVNGTTSAVFVDRIVHFLNDKLGTYPFNKIMSTQEDYKRNPVYGLNQLPDFVSPFPQGFEYDMEQLKNMTAAYLDNTIFVHEREDYWLRDAIQIKLMQEYINTYYPNMKLIGSLSNWFAIKWLHLADLEFNDQYPFLYLNMARSNLNQSLKIPKDSLVKFNKNIANGYYGGQGLTILSKYVGDTVVENSIKEFYSKNTLQKTEIINFQEILESKTDLPVNWFFEDYSNKRSVIDFKINKVTKKEDSLLVTIKNKHRLKMPVSVYGLNKKEIIYKTWSPPIDSITTITIPAKNIKRLALNYEGVIPEFKQRNNYKKITTLLNKPIQFRPFIDAEDPRYSQLFFMPVFEFNIYDGLSTGLKLYNKTLLTRPWKYKIEPQFGWLSKKIIGSASISYTQNYENNKPYSLRFGISGNTFSYNTDLLYRRVTPFARLSFRPDDLRNNEKQFINLRSVNVFRDQDPNDPDQEPNYSVLNASYVYTNPNLINFHRAVVDVQAAGKFGKIATTLTYRKLFINNRRLNLRLYAGAFLYNKTEEEDNFFSFALDRPTDYLFDYGYLGRSENDGIFSQQFIFAEGGFKSQLSPSFSNTWLTTLNASTNIWKWIHAYGDAGLINNKNQGTTAVFDSGVRLSLVEDFFELYFPLYSSLGWEPGLPNYDQRIRFIITLNPRVLIGLFTREWY